MRPVHGGLSLRPLDVQEPHHVGPLAAARLRGPQIYVKEHLLPALYLSFKLGLKGVPLAQKEAVDFPFDGSGTRRRRRRVAW
jgi:hypothetical protein